MQLAAGFQAALAGMLVNLISNGNAPPGQPGQPAGQAAGPGGGAEVWQSLVNPPAPAPQQPPPAAQ